MSLHAICHGGLKQKNVQKKLNAGRKCESPRTWATGKMVAPFMEIWKSGEKVDLPMNMLSLRGGWKPS